MCIVIQSKPYTFATCHTTDDVMHQHHRSHGRLAHTNINIYTNHAKTPQGSPASVVCVRAGAMQPNIGMRNHSTAEGI